METKVDRGTVKAELSRIYSERGALRPADVVEDARPDDAPLHPCFEWRDQVAADQYRLYQARHLIRTVVVQTDHGAGPVTAFVHVGRSDPVSPERGAYHPIQVVAQSRDMFASAVAELTAKVAGLEKSIADLYLMASGNAARTGALEGIRKPAEQLRAALASLAE